MNLICSVFMSVGSPPGDATSTINDEAKKSGNAENSESRVILYIFL